MNCLDLACIHAAAMGIPEEQRPDVLNGADGFHALPGSLHKRPRKPRRPRRPMSPEQKLRQRLKRAFGPWALRKDAVFFDEKNNWVPRDEALQRAAKVGLLTGVKG